jgi:hypothetical protein
VDLIYEFARAAIGRRTWAIRLNFLRFLVRYSSKSVKSITKSISVVFRKFLSPVEATQPTEPMRMGNPAILLDFCEPRWTVARIRAAPSNFQPGLTPPPPTPLDRSSRERVFIFALTKRLLQVFCSIQTCFYGTRTSNPVRSWRSMKTYLITIITFSTF